jgi:hypothetical protein
LVTMAQTAKQVEEFGYSPVAFWNGERLMHDGFWDDNAVGYLVKVEGRYKLQLDASRVEAYNQRMAA